MVTDIEGYEGRYGVDESGRVWNIRKRQELKPGWNGRYYVVTLYPETGARKSHDVHRLVAEAFIPNPEGLPLVRHVNGDARDNRKSNLTWSTNSENMRDRRRHGTDHNCNKTHCRNGHEYTPVNTYTWYRKGRDGLPSRRCRTCMRERDRKRRGRRVDDGV